MKVFIKNALAGFFILSNVSIYGSNPMPFQEEPTKISCLLRALSMIESGDNDKAIGKAGERSRYQILYTTWEIYSTNDFFTTSTDYETSTQVARLHLSKLIVRFHHSANRKPSIQEIYVMYNAGFSYYFNKQFDYSKVPKAIHNRSERFKNLYDKYFPDEAQFKLKI